MNGNLIAVAAAATLAAVLSGTAWADVAAGKTIFETNCATCHGMTGKGDGPVGMALNPKPRDLSVGDFKFDTDKDGETGTDADIKAVVQQGGAAFGGSALMAPWPTLSDDDVANVTAYIRTLKK